jgi:dienelactone hydrolase
MSDARRAKASKASKTSKTSNNLSPAPAGGKRRLAAALALTGLTALMLTLAAAQPGAAKEHETPSRPHVYLLRGLMNIFSLGMDQLAAKIAQRGIAASVHNHAEADAIVAQIAAQYRAGDRGPVILIGHSLGADAVMTMAQALNRDGVPVALVIPFDGTGSYVTPKNVACVLNLTQRNYMRSGAGFHGKLTNVNVSGDSGIDHFTIDKSPRLQAQALNSVLQTAKSGACRPGVGNSAAAEPKEQSATPAAPPLRPGIKG